jgi:hypothetical protein
MLMIAKISFFDVFWILLIGIGCFADFIHTGVRAEQLLGEWAAGEGCELIESDRCFFETGPFLPFSKGVVYRVKVSTVEGKIRSGWVRCGGWFFGVMSDHTAVIWD